MFEEAVEITESGVYKWPISGPGLIIVKAGSGGDGGRGSNVDAGLGGLGGYTTQVTVGDKIVTTNGGAGGEGGPAGLSFRGWPGFPGQVKIVSVALYKDTAIYVQIGNGGQGGQGGKARSKTPGRDDQREKNSQGRNGDNGAVWLVPIYGTTPPMGGYDEQS